MKNASCFRMTLLGFCLAITITAFLNMPARAAIVVVGAGGDQANFLNMMNAGSTGGVWAIGGGGNLAFTANGNALNNFATQMTGFDALGNVGTLNVGVGQGGTVVGAFLGGGVQRLDLGDIAAFPAASPNLDVRSSVLLHEVSELFDSIVNANAFAAAHLAGIAAENAELTALGSTGSRGAPPDGFRNLPGGVSEILVPWTDTANAATTTMVIRLNAAFNITNIRSGLIDTGVSYDGTELDIGIDSIFLEGSSAVSVPTTIWLIGLGLFGLLGVVRKKS